MMLKSVLGALLLGGSLANADLEVTWFKTLPERHDEYCRTSFPLNTFSCTVAEALSAAVLLPGWLGQIIEAHIAQAAQISAFDELSGEDFYHGHLLLRGTRDHFAKPADFFADVSAILYHTAEFNHRWETERAAGVPSAKRRPRSLLGLLNGQLTPAIERVQVHRPGYERSGTVYESDLEPNLPPSIFVEIEGHHMQMESLEFYILPQANGRFHSPSGEAFDLLIRGVENLAEAQLHFLSLPR